MPDNVAYLFAAFVVIWLLIFAYTVFIGGRVQGLQQELDLLRDDLDVRLPSALGAAATPETAEEPAPGAARRE